MDKKTKSYFDFNSKFVKTRIEVFEPKIQILYPKRPIWELRYYPNINLSYSDSYLFYIFTQKKWKDEYHKQDWDSWKGQQFQY